MSTIKFLKCDEDISRRLNNLQEFLHLLLLQSASPSSRYSYLVSFAAPTSRIFSVEICRSQFLQRRCKLLLATSQSRAVAPGALAGYVRGTTRGLADRSRWRYPLVEGATKAAEYVAHVTHARAVAT